MVVKRSPLRSLNELQAVAKDHLVVQPAEEAWPLLRALGIDHKSLTMSECHQRIQRAALTLTDALFVGCVRFGQELYDAYQIAERDLLCLSLESFRPNETLVLARHHSLRSEISTPPSRRAPRRIGHRPHR